MKLRYFTSGKFKFASFNKILYLILELENYENAKKKLFENTILISLIK